MRGCMCVECSMRNRKTPIATNRLTRRGLTALLAMLYLALIASLAVGFYASTNSAAMVTENEKRTNMSLMACEGGMDFMRFHLSQLAIPHGLSENQRMQALYNQLKDQLENTPNFAGKFVAITGNTISIPGNGSQFVRLDPSGTEFRCTITSLSAGEDGTVRVKITGRNGAYQAKRAVQLSFVLNQNASK